jgi:hypothetical protein
MEAKNKISEERMKELAAERKKREEEYSARLIKETVENKKHFHAIATLLGKDMLFQLMGHLGAEDLFDPDEGCGSRSCPHCYACSGEDQLDWKELYDENGKQLEIPPEEDGDLRKLKWHIECHRCGHVWEEYLFDME